jgi:hypothetical protein
VEPVRITWRDNATTATTTIATTVTVTTASATTTTISTSTATAAALVRHKHALVHLRAGLGVGLKRLEHGKLCRHVAVVAPWRVHRGCTEDKPTPYNNPNHQVQMGAAASGDRVCVVAVLCPDEPPYFPAVYAQLLGITPGDYRSGSSPAPSPRHGQRWALRPIQDPLGWAGISGDFVLPTDCTLGRGLASLPPFMSLGIPTNERSVGIDFNHIDIRAIAPVDDPLRFSWIAPSPSLPVFLMRCVPGGEELRDVWTYPGHAEPNGRCALEGDLLVFSAVHVRGDIADSHPPRIIFYWFMVVLV